MNARDAIQRLVGDDFKPFSIEEMMSLSTSLRFDRPTPAQVGGLIAGLVMKGIPIQGFMQSAREGGVDVGSLFNPALEREKGSEASPDESLAKFEVTFEVQVYAPKVGDAYALASKHLRWMLEKHEKMNLAGLLNDTGEPRTGGADGAPHTNALDGWRCIFSVREAT